MQNNPRFLTSFSFKNADVIYKKYLDFTELTCINNKNKDEQSIDINKFC